MVLDVKIGWVADLVHMTAYMCAFVCKIKHFCGGGGELWHQLLLLEEIERKCVCVRFTILVA